MQFHAQNLSAQRGDALLFTKLDFSMHERQLTTITGPNGIGKSTLLRIIAGFHQAQSGHFFLQEGDFCFAPSLACHYLGNQNAMKANLTVIDNLQFWAKLQKPFFLTPKQALQTVELAEIAHLPFGILSTGQKRRVAIARLLLSHQPLWLLDEPISGLDQQAINIFSNIVAQYLQKGGMVIAATHNPLGIRANFNIALEKHLPILGEV